MPPPALSVSPAAPAPSVTETYSARSRSQSRSILRAASSFPGIEPPRLHHPVRVLGRDLQIVYLQARSGNSANLEGLKSLSPSLGQVERTLLTRLSPVGEYHRMPPVNGAAWGT